MDTVLAQFTFNSENQTYFLQGLDEEYIRIDKQIRRGIRSLVRTLRVNEQIEFGGIVWTVRSILWAVRENHVGGAAECTIIISDSNISM